MPSSWSNDKQNKLTVQPPNFLPAPTLSTPAQTDKIQVHPLMFFSRRTRWGRVFPLTVRLRFTQKSKSHDPLYHPTLSHFPLLLRPSADYIGNSHFLRGVSRSGVRIYTMCWTGGNPHHHCPLVRSRQAPRGAVGTLVQPLPSFEPSKNGRSSGLDVFPLSTRSSAECDGTPVPGSPLSETTPTQPSASQHLLFRVY